MVERNNYSSQDITPINYSLLSQGDEATWEQVFLQEWNGLVRYNLRRPNSTIEDAEDAASEAFLVVWRNRESIDFNVNNGAHPILLTSARNRKIDIERKMGRHKETPLSPEVEFFLEDTSTFSNPDEAVLTNETNREVHHVLDMLPPDQKSALVTAYIEEIPQSCAINTLGIPLNTYKSWCHRGKNKFAKIWENFTQPVDLKINPQL